VSDGSAIDVLIICALKEELDALLEVRNRVADAWQPVAGDLPYYTATLEGRAGPIRVAAARPTKTAGVDAAYVASTLGERLKPRCVAMCGVCAGHPNDSDLGDVVIAERVFQHDFGKLKDTGFEGDIWSHILDDRWLHIAQDFVGKATTFHGYGEPDDEAAAWWFLERLVDKRNPQASGYTRYFRDDHGLALLDQLETRGHIEWTGAWTLTEAGRAEVTKRRARFKGVEVKTRPYHIHVAPMGSGNYVVADGEHWTTPGMRKLLALEQEAAAVGEVAHKRRVPFVIAKGVMDHGDSHKNDGFKKFAARASAEVLCEFLRRVIEPERSSAAPPESAPDFEHPTSERRFTGRSNELADLERLIVENQSVCVLATGIGGIGKTTLVSEFVATRGPALFPHGVAWIDGSPERFAGELARVSERFGWSTKQRGREPTRDEAVEWLKAALPNKRVLIVVDNLDPEHSDPKHVPIPGGRARTIVTSRTSTLDEHLGAARLPLGVWSFDVCRSYLRNNCSEDCPWLRTTSDAELNNLAEFVGLLPLGMRLLVSVLRRRTDSSPTELLSLLRAQPLGTLDRYASDRGVAATFRFAYDNLGEPERRVLQALAACAKQTRIEIVAAVADVELRAIGESLAYLRTHGFAEQPEQRVWGMHDVVRMFVLAQPGAEELEQRQLDWVRRHLQEHADPTAHRAFAEGVDEATHALSRWLGRDLPVAGGLYFPIEKHLRVVGRYADAVQLSEWLLDAAPPDSREAAVALGHLGLCYETLGDIPKAIEYHERSLAINEKLGRLEGQARQLGNLGLCYLTLGDIPKVIEYHERSLAIHEKLGLLEGQAAALGNLGVCYLTLGHILKAIEYHERSLAIAQQLGHLESQASELGNLGLCYQTLGDIPKAIEYHERSLAIEERLGRLEGQASDLGNLGLCHEQLGEPATAKDLFTRAGALFRRMGLPDNHPHVAKVERGLARLR
jgi:nucleoside phosphorylase